MDNGSRINKAIDALQEYIAYEAFPPKFVRIIKDFAIDYLTLCDEHSNAFENDCERLKKYLHLVRENAKAPFCFEPYHAAVHTPFDYHTFAIEMVIPLVDIEHSTLTDLSVIDHIHTQLKAGENVILLANHQSETDPQALFILLAEKYPELAKKLTFVAGDRVTSDPMAIPFSMGCNLLCIHSKRHIENPPEKKREKLAHNQKTMGILRSLLNKGGAFIYVAPSGGRDRKNAQGNVEVASFDPNAIELFYLFAKKAQCKTHFYPLALATYNLLPPPAEIEKELGEKREVNWSPIHAHFLEEIDMENFPGSDISDKEKRRAARATYIHSLVKKAHDAIQ